MKYLLDVSNTELKLSDRVKEFKLPVITGEHQLNYDLVECDIPKDIYAEWVGFTRKNGHIGNMEEMPIGFDNLPIGGHLIRIG